MNDEKYTFIEDCREKKQTARSYHNRVTHGGKVRLPSDYLTKKEIKAMSGEVKAYRLNDPMTWAEFKEMPDDIKITYIKLLRERFDVPDSHLGEMLGVGIKTTSTEFRRLGIGSGLKNGGRRKWDKEGFWAWAKGAADKTDEQPGVEQEAVPTEDSDVIGADDKVADVVPAVVSEAFVKASESMKKASEALHNSCDALEEAVAKNVVEPIVPESGTLAFNGNAQQILETIGMILNGANVKLSVAWTVVTDNG